NGQGDGGSLSCGGKDVGNFLGSYLPGICRGQGLAVEEPFPRRWTAVFRSAFRPHPKLLSFLQYLHRHALRLGFAEPISPTAEKMTLAPLNGPRTVCWRCPG